MCSVICSFECSIAVVNPDALLTAAYKTRQERAHGRKGPVNGSRFGSETGFPPEVRTFPNLFQELTMADVAFVVTMIAVFALVAFIAKGVAKL
jgi:hypothetical protein